MVQELPKIRIFCSYAATDSKPAQDLWGRLGVNLRTSKHYEWEFWAFEHQLLLGEEFEEEIQKAITSSDVGLMALSPTFLNSAYIKDQELPKFLAPGDRKRIAPLLLKRVSANADLHGLMSRQIFGYHDPYWNDKTPTRRDAWAQALDNQLHRIAFRYGLGQ